MRTIEEILEELQAIIDGAEERSLTDDEVEKYEKLEIELATARRNVEVRSRQTAYTTPTSNPGVGVHVAVTTEDDTLERAFDHYMRTGQINQDLVELRAQSVGTDTEGGFTVPEVFRQKLVDRIVEFGGLATVAETISTSGGEPMRWPTLDDTANQGVIAAEGAAGTGGTDLVFGEQTLGAFRYVAPGADDTGTGPLRVSVELLQDSAFDVQSLVSRKLGQRIAREQADHWVAGVGTTEPEGITVGVTQTQAITLAPTAAAWHDDLVDAMHTIDPAYRRTAVWVISDSFLAEIRKLRDADNRPIWTPSADSGLTTQPGGVLLGHRVVIDSSFDAFAASGNVGVFGDIAETYVIRRVRDLQLIVDPFTRAANGQVNFTLWARADGTVQNPFAAVTLDVAAV